MKLSSCFKLVFSCIGYLSLFGHFNTAFAQYKDGKTANGIMPNISPVSPEASSLGKYGDWPVSFYTGTVNITIPIYNIKVGQFELPIQLSYHTGGIKIDEIPSWCGSSWTLNAGGAITRSTVGLPDEAENGFLSRNLRNQTLKTTSGQNNSSNPYNLNDPNDYVSLKRITDQVVDSEPDLFFYNFAGQSGKFYFDQQGNFQSIPVNALKVINSPIKNPQISYWEIADQNGNLFYFGSGYTGSKNQGVEYSATHTLPQSGGAQSALEEPSAWFLTRIVVVNSREVINFDYLDKSESYKQAPVFSYRIFNDDFASGNNNADVRGEIDDVNNKLNIGQIMRNGVSSYSPNYSPTTVIITGKSRLGKITWSSGEIVFDSEFDRQDIMGKNLSKITLYDKSLNLIKENRFYYSYINERYYLDSLLELGSALLKKSAHAFEYESPELLPQKFTFGQDHWGYFNNANGNSHLLPADPAFSDPNVNANREPNESVIGYGILKKIRYPTGGSTEFQYEGNRYDGQDIPGGGNPIQSIVNIGKTVKASDPQDVSFQRIENFSSDFVINNTPIVIRFKNYNKPPSKRGGVLPIIKLERKLNDGSYVLVESWDAYDNFPINAVQNSDNLYDFDISKTVNLISAEYRIIADLLPEQFGLGDPLPIMPEISASINSKIYQLVTPSNSTVSTPSLIAGGLRIKEISNYTDGNLISRNQYTYTTGKLLLYPKYTHQYGEDVSAFKRTSGLCDFLLAKYFETTSSGQTMLGFTQGSPVGYQNIQEKSISPDGSTNGYTSYQYSFVPDELNDLHFNGSYWVNQNIMNKTFPLNNFEYKRGLLLQKDTYLKAFSGNFIKIHNLTNHYEFNDGNIANRYNSLIAMRVKKMIAVDYTCGDLYDGVRLPANDLSRNFAYSYYKLFTGWVQNKYSTETMYDRNGDNPVSMRTDYDYNNSFHLQITKTTKTISDGSSKVQQLVYPHEMINNGRDATGIYQEMVTENIISPVIEQTETTNGKSNIHLTNYIQPNTGVFVPGTIQDLNTITALNETRLRYHNYDNKGNPLSVSLEGGVKVNYVWSYSGQLIIAEVINAEYSEIQGILGGVQAVETLSLAADPTQAELNNAFTALRNNLPNAQVTTYTYKPLVGMTSQTDPKGMTTTYEYDEFQRLRYIRDQSGNILKQNTYHYKN